MVTRHRVVFCGAIYHVMARGNRKEMIFADNRDRRQFLKILSVALQKFGAECFGYCLMGNHYHLVIHTPRGNIANVMHHVDCLYARYVNWRHSLTGRLLEAPYAAIVIDDTAYLRNAIAYVLRNPVEAGMTQTAEQWPWSSYNATMGKASALFLTLDWLPLIYEAPSLRESRSLLAEHVAKQEEEYSDFVRTVAEGAPGFKKRVRKVIGATLYRAALPRAY